MQSSQYYQTLCSVIRLQIYESNLRIGRKKESFLPTLRKKVLYRGSNSQIYVGYNKSYKLLTLQNTSDTSSRLKT